MAPGSIERQLEPLLPGFVCVSAAMQRVADQIQRLQGNDLTVLITGESGTGKDLVAREIHAGSFRRNNMFLPYNCTSATRELADSQLFGHRRGSFTGAVADQPGVLRTAVGGTLFLDEVGDLPVVVRAHLRLDDAGVAVRVLKGLAAAHLDLPDPSQRERHDYDPLGVVLLGAAIVA